jgi:hypothetical protein
MIDAALRELRLDPATFWEAAPALAARTETPRELASSFLRQELGREGTWVEVRWLAAHVELLETTTERLWPRLGEEVALRERPIREQWEARGPGMLRRMIELAGAAFAIPAAEIALVQPCLGGGGEVHAHCGLVRLEAVLTNSWPSLPEPVRVGWLLFRLAAENAAFVGDKNLATRREAIALAAIPLALEAAEYVEWTACDPTNMDVALQAWRPKPPMGADLPQIAALYDKWRSERRLREIGWSNAVDFLAGRMGT